MSTKQARFINLRQGNMKPQQKMRERGYNPYNTADTFFYTRLRLMAGKVL